jgi:hypothetical protein
MQEVMPNTLIVLPMAPLALIIDRLHVTAVRWVVQFCFLVLQGQTSGKKEEHTSKQYIMAVCWIINHNLQTGSSLSISSLVVALANLFYATS